METIRAKQGFLPGIFKSRPVSNAAEAVQDAKWALLQRMPPKFRTEFTAMAGEFVGTFLFLFFAFSGTQVANTVTTSATAADGSITQSTDPSKLLYIALSFGFSLAVNAWVFYRVTGGLFNPAVTLGLCLIGAVPFKRGALVVVAQLLGAICSAGIVSCLFPDALAVATTLNDGTSIARGLFIEMFLTAQLVFTIFMLAAEKHKSTFIAPIGIGLSLFIAELSGVYYTGGSLNPARSFGPAVVLRSFPGYHWIYWLGPAFGALLAAGFYWFIRVLEYEQVNPGQDFDDLEAGAFNPAHEGDVSRPIVAPNAEPPEPTSPSLEKMPSSSRKSQATTDRISLPGSSHGPARLGSANGEKRDRREQSLNSGINGLNGPEAGQGPTL